MLKRRLARLSVVLILAASAVAGTTTSSQAASCQNVPGHTVPKRGSIKNTGTVGLGVIHLFDGHCTHGEYDAILPPGQDTYHYFGWAEVSAAYIGPTYNVTLSKPGTNPITYYARQYGFDVAEPYDFGGNWVVRAYR